MNSKLITNQIMNVIEASKQRIKKLGIESNEALQSKPNETFIEFTAEFREQINQLRSYLFDHYYSNHEIYRSNKRGQLIIGDLFNALVSDIKLIPKAFYRQFDVESNERIVCDYICGMTDSFAAQEHHELFS